MWKVLQSLLAKGNSKQVWDNINKVFEQDTKISRDWELQDKEKLTEEKQQIAPIFNNYFVDSVLDLAKYFGSRSKLVAPINNDFPVLIL